MNFLVSIKDFALKCRRVWKIIRKPTAEEIKMIAKVSAVGVLIIGFIGFLIAIIMTFLKLK